MEPEVRRGPGRPPKMHVAEPAVAEAAVTAFRRVKIVHYKVRTSQGRFIEGQFAELPVDEAAALIAGGQAC